ncbi:MAG TPA: hypothetical protein PKL54_07125 [Candidatus Hydrogenedentes bacterium]|nr:hypothetical protein [Candidatus Hydrogenedentota bacterium]
MAQTVDRAVAAFLVAYGAVDRAA